MCPQSLTTKLKIYRKWPIELTVASVSYHWLFFPSSRKINIFCFLSGIFPYVTPEFGDNVCKLRNIFCPCCSGDFFLKFKMEHIHPTRVCIKQTASNDQRILRLKFPEWKLKVIVCILGNHLLIFFSSRKILKYLPECRGDFP